jgi:hypothetical protein
MAVIRPSKPQYRSTRIEAALPLSATSGVADQLISGLVSYPPQIRRITWLSYRRRDQQRVREVSERDMQHRFIPEHDFLRLVVEGVVVDAASLSTYALMSLHRA